VKSIAVLPFKPLSADESDEYLGLGMADTLITKLSNLQQLIVRPTSVVRRYAEGEQDPIAAGREQRVDAVLEGSIQRAGQRIRVTVRLLNVADGRALWTYQFDEQPYADIFAVQDSISERVAESLAVKLTGEQRAALAKRYTENVEAYQLYLMGHYHSIRRVPEAFGPSPAIGYNLRKSIEYFQRAIEIDPNYALAYSGLSRSYATLPINSDVPSAEVWPRAKEAAMKALELDDALAEAHLSLGAIKFWIEWDWPGVEREFKRAIELNPNHALAHFWYAHYLSNMGRHSEAIAEAKRAFELDPVSPMTSLFLGQFLYQARQYDEAIEPLQNALEIVPNDWIAHLNLGKVYVQQKKYGEAIAEFQKAREFSRGTTETISVMGHALAVSGQRAEAHKVLDELKRMSKQRYVPPYNIAAVYAGLGEKEQVLDWLEKAYEERDVRLVFLKIDPKWDGLRTEPRFNDLLRRIGLAP
jgi:serine/threonine-protein kinase